MFIDNKYTNTYYSIVSRAKIRDLSGYVEKHHIIPRSLGGSNFKENIAILTAREHFICHWLLIKMLKGKNKSKMYHALNLMLHAENPYQTDKRYKFTSRIYEIFKKNYAVILSKQARNDNPMHNPDTKLKHAAATQKRGKTAGMTGRKHTEETKRTMRKRRAEQIITEETKEKLRIINIHRDYDPGNTGQVAWYNPITKVKKFFNYGEQPGIEWRKGSYPITKVTCPHCGKTGSKAPMNIWHFDKCKEKNK